MCEIELKPVGYCIYCNERDGAMTDEHLVPYSLGGNILLPKSSCTRCQTAINRFESPVVSQTYNSFRAAHRYPSRTGALPKCVPVKFDLGSVTVKRLIPIDDAPFQSVIPKFAPPPYQSEDGQNHAELCLLPINESRFKSAFKYCPTAKHLTVESDPINLNHFVRLIYKISYGFTWVADQQCAWKWQCRPLILSGDFTRAPEYDGIYSAEADGIGIDVYRVTLFTHQIDDRTELFCQVRILNGATVPAYICRMGETLIRHPFGLEFSPSQGFIDISKVWHLLPSGHHLPEA